MSAVCNDDSGTVRTAAGVRPGGWRALAATDWLSLAAAPAFAIMALLTGLSGSGAMAMCGMDMHAAGWFSLDGMVPMYLLMSVFHAPPWVRLLKASRRGYVPARRGSRD